MLRTLFGAVAGSAFVLMVLVQGCGSGAGQTCEAAPCFRANECVASCGGPVKYSGCCSCPTGTFDRSALKCGTTDGDPGCGECVRPYECVNACGGTILYAGCCACPQGSFDRISCPDASQDATTDSSADAANDG